MRGKWVVGTLGEFIRDTSLNAERLSKGLEKVIGDVRLLMDYFGVEITTTPEKRVVVKKVSHDDLL